MDETQTTGQNVPVNTDTTDTQASEAAVQTNTDAPKAPQEVKETATEATDTAEEKLYAGKYKDVETLENSYKELESKYGKEAGEKAELTRILNEAFAAPETTETATETFEDSSTVNPEFEQMKRDNAVVKFILGHQDANGEAMKQVLADDPLVKQIQGHDAKLEYAYLRSQSMSQPKVIEEARKSAQAETQAKTAEKQAAQVESAKSAAPVEDKSDYSVATGNFSSSEREAARLNYIRKNLVNL